MTVRSSAFLIDSSALITPFKSYYPFDIAPSFWEQIKERIESGDIVLLDVVKGEIEKAKDELSAWCEELNPDLVIDKRQTPIIENYSRVLTYIQTCEFYTPHALAEWSNVSEADPWLVATAMYMGCTIITFESSAGGLSKRTPSKRCKIPDVCDNFNVKYDNLYTMMRELSIKLK